MGFDFKAIRAALGGLKGQLKNMDDQLEHLHQVRDELDVVPVAKDEVIRCLHERIDEMAAEHLKLFSGHIRAFVESGNFKGIKHHATLMRPTRPNTAPSFVSMDAAISFALGDQLKAAVVRAVDLIDFPQGAMTAEERDAALAKVDAEIAEIEAGRANLAREAAAAGLSI